MHAFTIISPLSFLLSPQVNNNTSCYTFQNFRHANIHFRGDNNIYTYTSFC